MNACPRPMEAHPRNHTTGAERLAIWKKEGAQGQARRPRRVQGSKARWEWIDSICEAVELSSTVRHVAVMLALAGNADGSSIFPGIRRLASRCNLSARVVSKSISRLVCCGRLMRKPRGNGPEAGAGAGFEYLLTIPTVLTDDQHYVCTDDQHQRAKVCTQDQHQTEVCTDDQHGVNPGAGGVNPGDTKVCTDGSPTSPLPIQIPGAGTKPAAPGELAKARPARRRTGPNVVTLDAPDERVRKAKLLIAAHPDMDDETLARMVRGLQPNDLRRARAA